MEYDAEKVGRELESAQRSLSAALKNKRNKGDANHFINEAINKLLQTVKLTR